jgi:hypothetical protein
MSATAMRTPGGTTRRRHPRIEIDGGHEAQDLTAGQDVRIRDISLGGFQTAGPRSCAIGATHTFRIRLTSGRCCLVQATAVHSSATPAGAFVVGWRAETDIVTIRSIEHLIQDVTTLALADVPHA